MPKSKPMSPEAFLQKSERVVEAADVLKAMASDTRLKILCALNETELSVTQLAELTRQSSSAVSQHLSRLRAAGLVASRRDAQTIYYRCSGGIGSALVNTLCDFYG
tara:strand:+ start:916 stop:1233 length:318 start_codon:yes stop_codon:yes gene_type:complete